MIPESVKEVLLPVVVEKKVTFVPLAVEKSALGNLADKIGNWLKRTVY